MIIICEKKRKGFVNPKCHYILNYFPVLYQNESETINFLTENKSREVVILIYIDMVTTLYDWNLLNFVKENMEDCLCKIYFLTFDFWEIQTYEIHNNFINSIFKTKNYKVLTFASKDKLNFFHNEIYDKYDLITFNYWGCYDTSFLEFNENPDKTLLISGATKNPYYPERYILSRLKNKYIKYNGYNKLDIRSNNNNYNQVLNSNFASFSSSVHILSKTTNKIENTHIILLKTFEILGAGSLLVMPKQEEIYLNEIGLYDRENCYLIDFSKDINEQVNFIFNNLEIMNEIRKKGQGIAKQKFTSSNKIKELKSLLNICI